MTPIATFVLIACIIAGALIGRRRRRRGILFGTLTGIAAAAAITGILHAIPSGPSGHDYRDSAQLAEAMKDAHHAAGANCGKLPAGTYFCAVAFTDGTSASYTVTVAADGSSYTAS
jgi:hypothetical protein